MGIESVHKVCWEANSHKVCWEANSQQRGGGILDASSAESAGSEV